MKIEGFASIAAPAPVSVPAQKSEKPRPSASFKLKEAFQNTPVPEDSPSTGELPETAAPVSGRDPFDADRVVQLLDAYIVGHTPEIAVSIGLKAHAPAVSGEEITIRVDNRLQLEKIEALAPSLQILFRQRLNNGSVKLSLCLNEEEQGQDDRKLITNQDKWEFFTRRNPAVLELKKVFGLELD